MYKKAWCTCKVVVLPILKPIAFSPSSLLQLSNIQKWGQEFSAQNPLSQPCRQDVRCMWRTNLGRHDYKFRATWLWFRARWLSGDLTLNPCTAPGKSCSHWLYRSSWINRLRSWPVQLCSLVSMMACIFSCSTFKSFTFDLMYWQYR